MGAVLPAMRLRSRKKTFACFFDPTKITSGQRFFSELAQALGSRGAVGLKRADVVLFNVSAPLGEFVKARLRRQEVVVRLDGVYHDRLSEVFIGSFRSAGVRAVLRLGLRFRRLETPLSKLANLLNRNYGAMARALLAHRFVYQSRFGRQSWAHYFPNKPAAVIVNGATWQQQESSAAPSAEIIQLVTIYDDWRPTKRIDDLIEFVHWCNEQQRVPVRLKILGFSGKFPKTFSARTKELMGSSPYIQTLPRFSAIDGVVKDAFVGSHAYITFTFRDSCPNVVVEAMSLGLPVVATRSGGLEDIVGDAGRLIPLGDDPGRHFCASRYESDFPAIDFAAVLEAVQDVARDGARYRQLVERRFATDLGLDIVAARYAAALVP